MQIEKQTWYKDGNNYVFVNLREPYWSAYQKYAEFGWPDGVPGIGLSMKGVNMARKDGCGIIVHIEKYGTYRISPNKIEKYANQNFIYKVSEKIYLWEFPKSEFDIIKESDYEKQESEEKEAKREIQIHQDLLSLI
ncbi:MAG TPA: hypothetical protein PL165_07665 [Methanofastidiosum sp.]|nr:hypothetical protein [Methanofastidiosum sp.]